MKNGTTSKLRSQQLHEKGQQILRQVQQIPYGLEKVRVERQNQRKKEILAYLKGSEKDWNDWKWQIAHRIQSVEDVAALLHLSSEAAEEIKEVAQHFRFAVSPYYLSLIDEKDIENDPVAMMSLPVMEEMAETGVADPSAEEDTNPAGKIVRRYPNRVIINITNCCASFCRHCQRKRIIGSHDRMITPSELEQSIAYIREHSEIRDVLITGGDSLTLSDRQLEEILAKVKDIPHVKMIRLGSRMPVNLPQRITRFLVDILKRYGPIYLNTQFNHPLEVTPEAVRACGLLADNGVILGNQMVLLKGVNDDKYVVQRLNEQLMEMRVRPYYIFRAKDVKGTLHFQTSVTAGIDILSHLWGNTSGLSIPRYIVSAPNGMGKMEINKDTVLRKQGDNFGLLTWEGIPVSIPDDPA